MSDPAFTPRMGEDRRDPAGTADRIGPASADGSPVDLDRDVRQTIRILVVEDERTLRESCASALRREGYTVSVTGSGEEALELIDEEAPEILLVDLYMPGVSGMELLREATRREPPCLVVVMTGRPSVESSIDALRAGAWSYLPKPFSGTQLEILIGRAAHAIVVARESREEPDGAPAGGSPDAGLRLLGASDAFRRVLDAARQVAATDASVFISGESGTGKELVARYIHRQSARRSRELVPVNSAAIPQSLLESEMFGHVEGAFTGAVREKKGLLETANGGTLFLDEVTEMPLPVQAKLLRVIQDGVVRRVGSTTVDAIVDVRFVAATNRDPDEAVQEGLLRQDFHYRLRVFPIHIPPLRERPEDIPVLAEHFLDHFWAVHRGGDLEPPVLGDDAHDELRRRPWTGNVRELRNVIEHAVVVLSPGVEVGSDDIPSVGDTDVAGRLKGFGGVFQLHDDYRDAREHVLGEFERNYVHFVVERARGNVSEAARIAGVDRTTIYRLMDKHEIDPQDLVNGFRH